MKQNNKKRTNHLKESKKIKTIKIGSEGMVTETGKIKQSTK